MIRIIPFILLFVILYSCNSPLDVPADSKKKELIEDPYNIDPVVAFKPDSIDLGFVLPNKEIENEFLIQNISDKKIELNSYEFLNDKFKMDFDKILLNPSGQPDDSYTAPVEFNSPDAGVFIDTLIFNDMYNPVLKLFAKVPHVFAEDLDFGEVATGRIKPSFISLHNLSEDTVDVMNIVSTEPDIFSVQHPGFPLELPPNSVVDDVVLIRFSPENVGEFTGTITVKTQENNLIVKEFAKISGKGID